jgi:hypothetical protein
LEDGRTGSGNCQIASCGIVSLAAFDSFTGELVITKTDHTGIGYDPGRYVILAEDRCNCVP